MVAYVYFRQRQTRKSETDCGQYIAVYVCLDLERDIEYRLERDR